jgi:hypothetical protein
MLRNGCQSEGLEKPPAVLSVEREVNGDSRSVNERGPSLVGSLGLSCSYNKKFVLPSLL